MLEEQISKQRIQHIVDSYQLAGNEVDACADYLTELLEIYAPGLVELALVEAIVSTWTRIPRARGIAAFKQVRDLLILWQTESISISFSPEEFQQITGLSANAIFGTLPSLLNAERSSEGTVRPC